MFPSPLIKIDSKVTGVMTKLSSAETFNMGSHSFVVSRAADNQSLHIFTCCPAREQFMFDEGMFELEIDLGVSEGSFKIQGYCEREFDRSLYMDHYVIGLAEHFQQQDTSTLVLLKVVALSAQMQVEDTIFQLEVSDVVGATNNVGNSLESLLRNNLFKDATPISTLSNPMQNAG